MTHLQLWTIMTRGQEGHSGTTLIMAYSLIFWFMFFLVTKLYNIGDAPEAALEDLGLPL